MNISKQLTKALNHQKLLINLLKVILNFLLEPLNFKKTFFKFELIKYQRCLRNF